MPGKCSSRFCPDASQQGVLCQQLQAKLHLCTVGWTKTEKVPNKFETRQSASQSPVFMFSVNVISRSIIPKDLSVSAVCVMTRSIIHLYLISLVV